MTASRLELVEVLSGKNHTLPRGLVLDFPPPPMRNATLAPLRDGGGLDAKALGNTADGLLFHDAIAAGIFCARQDKKSIASRQNVRQVMAIETTDTGDDEMKKAYAVVAMAPQGTTMIADGPHETQEAAEAAMREKEARYPKWRFWVDEFEPA